MDKQDRSWPDVRRYTSKLFPRIARPECPGKYSFPSVLSSGFKIRECLSRHPANFHSVRKYFLPPNAPRSSPRVCSRSISSFIYRLHPPKTRSAYLSYRIFSFSFFLSLSYRRVISTLFLYAIRSSDAMCRDNERPSELTQSRKHSPHASFL